LNSKKILEFPTKEWCVWAESTSVHWIKKETGQTEGLLEGGWDAGSQIPGRNMRPVVNSQLMSHLSHGGESRVLYGHKELIVYYSYFHLKNKQVSKCWP
jgi:hypothetical protein